MVLVVHDPAVGDIREIEEFELDLAFGSDENALKLEARAGEAPEEGQFVFIDGTEYGGVIDQASYEAGREATDSILCRGRTWHGILAGKRLLPDSGSGYLAVSGKAGDVLASLIARMGLSALFSASPDDTEVSYTFERFCDGYSGLKALAKANGRKVAMRRKGGKVEISLPPAVDYANKVDSDLLDFKLTSVHRCVNHLVCAGTGELEDRAVVHFYADSAGNVSHTQSLFGVDEISALYDYSNADEAQLEEEGRKKLQEYQTQGSVEVEAHDDIDVDVGDVISARDNAHGRTVTANVAKKIVKVSRGVATYSYEVGSETTTKTSSSGTAESSGGGHAYLAGKGLTLEGYTFNADVDAESLAAVEAKADKRTIYSLSAPELQSLPSIGTAKEFDLEGCAALTPDLVIVPAKLKDSIPQMEELGLTVLAVKPEDQDKLYGAIDLLAQATNTVARGEELKSAIEDNLLSLREAIGDAEAPTVYMAGNSSVLQTAGPAMYQNYMIENAGGLNAAAGVEDTYWAEVSYEQVLDWDPDYIILASDADYDVDSVLNDAALADCTAVREGHVYQLPHAIEAVDSPVPGSFLGSVYLGSVLHPEQVSEQFYHDCADAFYTTYYGFTPAAYE